MNSSKVKPAVNPDAGAGHSDNPGAPFETLVGTGVFRFTSRPRLKKSPVVIGWTSDAGAVGSLTADYLIKVSNGVPFCRIEPSDFYRVGAISVTDDVARFPQSRFFYSDRDSVVVLRADEPQSNRYEYLSAVLNLAEHYGKSDLDEPSRAETLYAIHGIAAATAHTAARSTFGVFSDAATRKRLQPLVPANTDWQGPPQMSTYLLWLAGRRHVPAVSLWVEVPFYLSNYEDYRAVLAALSVLGTIPGWNLDLGELDRLADEQADKLARLDDDPQIAGLIRALEDGQSLERREQAQLIEAVGNVLDGHA